MHELQRAFQGQPAAAPRAGTRGGRGRNVVPPGGRQPWHHRCPPPRATSNTFCAQRLQSGCPQAISCLRARLRHSYRGTFPTGFEGARGPPFSGSIFPTLLGCSSGPAPAQGTPAVSRSGLTGGGGDTGSGRGSGLTLQQVLEVPLLQEGRHFILRREREEPR